MDIEAFPNGYATEPFKGRLVAGVLGRTLNAKPDDTADDMLFRNAEGGVKDGMSNLIPKLKQPAVTEPLPPSIIAAIRAAEKQKAKNAKSGG